MPTSGVPQNTKCLWVIVTQIHGQFPTSDTYLTCGLKPQEEACKVLTEGGKSISPKSCLIPWDVSGLRGWYQSREPQLPCSWLECWWDRSHLAGVVGQILGSPTTSPQGILRVQCGPGSSALPL